MGGLVPRAASAVLGGLVPRTDSAVLGGLLFTSAAYCDFRTHGPHMRIDDLSAPSGRFIARVPASVTTVDRCPGRGRNFPAADNDSLRSSPYPPRSARAPQKPLLPRRPSPSRLLRGVLLRGVIRLSPRANPRPPLSRLALRCPRRSRLGTASRPGHAGLQQQQLVLHLPMSTMALGPAGPLDHLPGGLTPRREFPRPRPGPPTAATPAPAASSVPTVPIPSDRDRAEPVGTPLLQLTPPLGNTTPAPAKLDALGDAAEL